MEFFPIPPEPQEAAEVPEPAQPVWLAPPEAVMPGVVPVELILGRSESTVVALTGMRAFPSGVQMNLAVHVRGKVARLDLNGEVFDGPYRHDVDAQWQAGRLKWGFELSDGSRVTNVDPWPQGPHQDDGAHHHHDTTWQPNHPVLMGGGGGGGNRCVERSYWLWPLPPAGTLLVVCQWLDQDIELSTHTLDAGPFLDAARRAQPVWPST